MTDLGGSIPHEPSQNKPLRGLATGLAPKGHPGFATILAPAYWERTNPMGRIL